MRNVLIGVCSVAAGAVIGYLIAGRSRQCR